MNRRKIARVLRDRDNWRAKANLLTKVSIGLAILVIILTVLFIASSADQEHHVYVSYADTTEPTTAVATEPEPTTEVETTAETTAETEPETEPETTTAYTEVVVSDPENPVVVTDIGKFTITYYCSCKICCGAYASNRPTVNGQEIVFTSTGEIAQDGITVAVDPSRIPYGTLLYIEGVGYRVAQDCGGAIKGNRIDVYMDDHQEALQSGMHSASVYKITSGG